MRRILGTNCLLRLSLAFLICFCARAQAQASKTWTCEASPEVQAALWKENDPTRLWPLWHSLRVLRTPLKETALGQIVPPLVERFPGDFWVERARIDAARNLAGVASETMIEESRRRYEAAPKDPEAAYLYGYALINKDSARTIELLTVVTVETPEFPAAWMTLANIYNYDFRSWALDEGKTKIFAEGYFQRCPGSLQGDAISLLTELKPSDALIAYTRALRQRIAGKANPATLPFYTLLWTLESTVAPPEQLGTVRAALGEDVKFLAGLDAKQYPGVEEVIATGNGRITGNSQSQAPRFVFNRALSDWRKMNPEPDVTAGMDARKPYYRKQLEFIEPWLAKTNNEPEVLMAKMRAMASLDDAPGDALLAVGEKLLAAARAAGNGDWVLSVANSWRRGGIALDRVPSLVDEYLDWETRRISYYDSDLCRGTFYELRRYKDRWYVDLPAWQTLAWAQIRQGDFSAVRATLKRFETALPELRARVEVIRAKYTARASETTGGQPSVQKFPVVEDNTAILLRTSGVFDNGVQKFPVVENDTAYLLGSVEHDYNEIRGGLAEAEGRKLDALTYYAAAMQSRPDNASGGMVLRALELWRNLGGTAEALETWRKPSRTADTISTIDAAMFPPSDAVATSRPLIDFSFPDRNGKQWTLADLKGKTTLINVWATWCPPCREELPQVQALYQKLAERKDVQLVTLNVDSERLLVEPFLKENKYSFPVIYADWDYIDSFVQKAWGGGIPQNWISDSNGVVRFRLLYDVSDTKWLEKALATIDKVH